MNYRAGDSNPFQELAANLERLLPIGLALAAWAAATWAKLKKKPEGTPAAAGEDERTRRVQEEVRRKIAERRGRRTELDEPPVRAAPAGSAVDREWRGRRGEFRPIDPFGGPPRPRLWPAAPPAGVPLPPDDAMAKRERQERIVAPVPAPEPAAARTSAGPVPGPAAQDPVISPWLAQLREPSGVRRAIILREILGTPVGLR